MQSNGESFTLLVIKLPTRMRRVQTEDNIGTVADSVAEDRDLSMRNRLQ